MAKVTTTVTRRTGLSLSRRAQSLPDDVLRRAEAVLRQGAEEILQDAKLNYVPEDLSSLKNSGRIEEDNTGNSVVIRIVFGGPQAPHALFVHEGTQGPRKAPPPGVILEWVERHFAVDHTEAKQIAYFIGQRIAREGTQPVKYLEIPFRRHLPKITAKIRAVGAGKNAVIE